jgi:hypothetical protein
MKKQITFDDIVRGDFKIDGIIKSQAERLCLGIKGLNVDIRYAIMEAITGDIAAARAVVLAWRSHQAGHQIEL